VTDRDTLIFIIKRTVSKDVYITICESSSNHSFDFKVDFF